MNTATLDTLTTPAANLSMNSNKIINLAAPTASGDAVTKGYADSNYYPTSTTLNTIAAPTGSVSLNSQKITNLADATAATDALNRQTADARYY